MPSAIFLLEDIKPLIFSKYLEKPLNQHGAILEENVAYFGNLQKLLISLRGPNPRQSLEKAFIEKWEEINKIEKEVGVGELYSFSLTSWRKDKRVANYELIENYRDDFGASRNFSLTSAGYRAQDTLLKVEELIETIQKIPNMFFKKDY